MELLDQLEATATELALVPYPSDEEAADWVGRINAVVTKLNGLKRGLLSEMPGPVVGSQYRITEDRAARRTYNSAAILHSFGEAGWGLTDLLRRDAVRLTWRWTELDRAFAEAKVEMLKAYRELEETGDVEGPHVGEVWEIKQGVKGI